MNTPPNQPPCFVSCRCQHCDGHIEFDASGFAKGETRNVECPHCQQETNISCARFNAKKTARGQNAAIILHAVFPKC